MKTYLKIPEHGHNGDFYHCGEGDIFRADNLEIATMLAANHWLYNFDNVHRSCEHICCNGGEFQFRVEGKNFGYEVIRQVEYYGPANMHEANFLMGKAASNPLIVHYILIMRTALQSGNENVRLSKGSSNSANEGLPMFTCQFPRWRENGDWWPCGSAHLCYTDVDMATDQMRHAGLI